ncbi:type VII secretion system (Wss) protein ESAT-6 [Labedella gwakjiensis]|uniref:Type VII secretion system (Wss) protein ESAT-6 n=1 Tax=Labedella gwakjiensis TaxID=390269 RepID=A0A2P8GX35_9MICO|nr:WXG100 family type VII secretion target [Labedella gwakjiensis]PSL38514.1 type VII secretion system (Wss) protein ESAT-6 [Labedella gwakjiensis]RUQ86973.1 hypothetical protein ELQ93_08520 [Labedella gwakjiensis]
MVQYRVRANSLGEVSTLLDSVVATFDSNLATASATVSSVAGSTWQGADADKFVELWGQYEEGALLVRAALSGLAGQLRMAEAGYISNEAGLSGGFANRRQSTVSQAGGASAFAQRVAASQNSSAPREEAGADAELQSEGYASFVGGGMIAAKTTNGKGEPTTSATADGAEDGESSDV